MDGWTSWRRSRRAAVASALLALGGLVPAVAVAGRAAAALPRVTVIGDSTLLGMRSDGAALIAARHDLNLQAASCRRLIEVSCDIPFRPTNTIDVMRAQAGRLGSVVVIMAGYDDFEIAEGVDVIVAEAARQGVSRVVWLTYMEDVTYTGLGGQTYADVFRAHNAVLRAKLAQHPILALADWNAHADPHPEWFSSDGIHLSGAGSPALGAFIAASLDSAGASRCAAASAGGSAIPTGAPATPSASPAGFEAVVPTRLLDTRAGAGLPLGAGRQFEIDVTAHASATATAVAVNLTAAPACLAGYVTAYPCGGRNPLASNLNTRAGIVVAGHAIVPLTAGQRTFCVMSSSQTELVVDLMGVYDTGTPPLATRQPERVLDTRTSGTRLAGGTALAVRIPAGRPVTAVLNLTMVEPLGAGFLTAYPANDATGACDPAARPLASAINASAGATVANLAQLASGGANVCVYSNVATHVVIDMTADHSIGGTASLRAVTPARLVDTRVAGGLVAGGTTLAVRVPQPGAAAAALNVTAVDARGQGYVTAWPADAAGGCAARDRPLASMLNVAGPDPVPNLTVVSTGGAGTVCLFAQTTTHLVVDQSAWYG